MSDIEEIKNYNKLQNDNSFNYNKIFSNNIIQNKDIPELNNNSSNNNHHYKSTNLSNNNSYLNNNIEYKEIAYNNYNDRVRFKWSKEEDIKLIEIIKRLGKNNWKQVSNELKTKTRIQCFHRYKRIISKNNFSQWTPEEDNKVKELFKKYGCKWSLIAKHLKSRSSSQIRERYVNILDVYINKEKFSKEEDELLQKLFLKYGKKWTIICKYFDRRTPDKIKSRFYTKTLKELKINNLAVYNNIIASKENAYRNKLKSMYINRLYRRCKVKHDHSNVKNNKICIKNILFKVFKDYSKVNDKTKLKDNKKHDNYIINGNNKINNNLVNKNYKNINIDKYSVNTNNDANSYVNNNNIDNELNILNYNDNLINVSKYNNCIIDNDIYKINANTNNNNHNYNDNLKLLNFNIVKQNDNNFYNNYKNYNTDIQNYNDIVINTYNDNIFNIVNDIISNNNNYLNNECIFKNILINLYILINNTKLCYNDNKNLNNTFKYIIDSLIIVNNFKFLDFKQYIESNFLNIFNEYCIMIKNISNFNDLVNNLVKQYK